MKQIWSSLLISFSMYSKIPAPKRDWSKENMCYVMCFFPLIGAVIGGICYLWGYYGSRLPIGDPLHRIVLLLIPVIITGGIHLDGLLDTTDALGSHQERERKLEILKDPHAGAFAMITAVLYFLLYYGIYMELSISSLPIVCLGFIASRALSGFAVATFPLAKNTGLVALFSKASSKLIVRLTNGITAGLMGILMCFFNPVLGGFGVTAMVLTMVHYYHMSKKQFGGITGDLAGYFLMICELTIAGGVVIGEVLIRS